ncbi:MAG: hypothetical protein ACYTFY_12255 [Planctomycetota bacterium]|jgi:hypothetical protein
MRYTAVLFILFISAAKLINGAETISVPGAGKVTVDIVEGVEEKAVSSDITLLLEKGKVGEFTRINAKVTNKSKDKKFLNVRISAAPDLKNPHFWDGHSVFNSDEKEVFTEDMFNRLPYCTMYDKSKAVTLGVDAASLYSYLGVKRSGNIFSLNVRAVLMPGQSKIIEFIALGIETRWGFRKVVDLFMEAYPQFSRPHKGIDPRAHKGLEGSYEAAYNWQYHPYPEIFRRSRITWNWVYAPYRRSGDFYGRKEFWDNPSSNPEQKRFQENRVGGRSPEEWREYRKSYFQYEDEADVAMHFYAPNVCERHLLKTVYPEHTIYPTGNFNALPKQEISTRIFPAGGTYGPQYEKDMKLLFAENQLSGIAWDSVGGMGQRKYRGKVMWEMPLVSFDKEGEYVISGVGAAKNIDYLHTVPILGGRYNASANGNLTNGTVYCAAMRFDTYMHEDHVPYYYAEKGSEKKAYDRLLVRRRLFGQKPCVNHKTWRNDRFGEKIDWKKYHPDQIHLLYRSMLEHRNITMLYAGVFPNPDALWGIPENFKFTDLIIDMVARGWKDVPAAVEGKDYLLRRYGNNLDGAIAVMNSEPGERTISLEMLGHDLAGRAPLLTPYGGGEAVNAVRGVNTKVSVPLKIRGYKVYEIIADIDGAEGGNISVSSRFTKHKITLTLNSKAGKAAGEIRFPLRKNYKIPQAYLNGKELEVKMQDNFAVLKAELSKGKELTVNYNSEIWQSEDSKLTNFAFFNNEISPEVEIVLPENSNADLKRAADWVSGYFEFWYKFGPKQKKNVKLPIVNTASGTRKTIVFKVGAKPAVKVTGEGIVYSSTDSYSLAGLVRESLNLLDEKHPFYGKFHAGFPLWRNRKRFEYNEKSVQMLIETGILGGTIHLYQGKELADIPKLSAGELDALYKSISGKNGTVKNPAEKSEEKELDTKAEGAGAAIVSFDNLKGIKAVKGYKSENVKASLELFNKVEGGASIYMELVSQDGGNGVGELIAEIPETDFAGKSFAFSVKPADKNQMYWGVEFIDTEGNIAERHRQAYVKPEEWTEVSFKQGRKNKYGWMEKGKGDIKKITRLRFRVMVKQNQKNAALLWDNFHIKN